MRLAGAPLLRHRRFATPRKLPLGRASASLPARWSAPRAARTRPGARRVGCDALSRPWPWPPESRSARAAALRGHRPAVAERSGLRGRGRKLLRSAWRGRSRQLRRRSRRRASEMRELLRTSKVAQRSRTRARRGLNVFMPAPSATGLSARYPWFCDPASRRECLFGMWQRRVSLRRYVQRSSHASLERLQADLSDGQTRRPVARTGGRGRMLTARRGLQGASSALSASIE